MSNTFTLMGETAELIRAGAVPQEALEKLQEAVTAFQEFEKSCRSNRIQEQDYQDLQRICRWCVMFDGVESRFDQIGRLAADVLIRHGVDAGVDENGAVMFVKVKRADESQG